MLLRVALSWTRPVGPLKKVNLWEGGRGTKRRVRQRKEEQTEVFEPFVLAYMLYPCFFGCLYLLARCSRKLQLQSSQYISGPSLFDYKCCYGPSLWAPLTLVGSLLWVLVL